MKKKKESKKVEEERIGNTFQYSYTQFGLFPSIQQTLKKKSRVMLVHGKGGQTSSRHWEGVLVATTPDRFLTKKSFNITKLRSTNDKITKTMSFKGHYAIFKIELRRKDMANTNMRATADLDIDYSADEWSKSEGARQFSSQIQPLNGMHFSIRLPLEKLPDDTVTRDAILVLTLNNIQHEINDLYNFTANSVVTKENTLPVGTDEVDLLFMLK
jgi:hypothetical protein